MSIIRLATAADAPALAAIYAPSVRDAVTSFELEPPSAEEMATRVAAVLAYAPWLVLAGDGGDLAGYAYATRHRDRAAYQWSVDVSVYVDARHHRRGVGRRLYGVLFELLRIQGFHTAHAGITMPNPASVGLHEALGFTPIAVYPAVGFKHGAWRDTGWWRLPLLPTTSPPAPLRTPAACAADPAWSAALARGA